MKGLLSISIPLLLNALAPLGGEPMVLEEDGAYTRIQVADSATVEVFQGDSITVVMTVCAPQCSSCARVYNKEWEFIHPIPPTLTSIFPLATMDKKSGHITWSDNDLWEYNGAN